MPAPTAQHISKTMPGPPPLFEKFTDPASGRLWWNGVDGWFWEDSPGEWQKYKDPASGRFWWWNGMTQGSFITHEMCGKSVGACTLSALRRLCVTLDTLANVGRP